MWECITKTPNAFFQNALMACTVLTVGCAATARTGERATPTAAASARQGGVGSTARSQVRKNLWLKMTPDALIL